MEILSKQFRAPEVYGDLWLNSDPISISALRGYPILLDFWDYTSLGSIRSLPYVKEWHRRYADLGLVVIGVHTPAFPFGRDPRYIRNVVSRAHARYPIVLDNDGFAWNAFGVRIWPTKILIDKNGFISYRHEGEGSYQNIEHAIQSLLSEAGHRGDFPLVMEALRDTDWDGALCYRPTPEILTGYHRGTIGNIEGFNPEFVAEFIDPGFYLDGRIYLHGNWFCDRNYVKLQEAEAGEGRLVLTYQAQEANIVVKPEGESNFQVFVKQDDAYLTNDSTGEDIRIDGEGRSFLLINEPRLYNIVRNREFGEHKLTLVSRSNGFALYALSFATGLITEGVSSH